jgi:hypothetical protein
MCRKPEYRSLKTRRYPYSNCRAVLHHIRRRPVEDKIISERLLFYGVLSTEYNFSFVLFNDLSVIDPIFGAQFIYLYIYTHRGTR